MNSALIQKELGRMIRKKQDSEIAPQSAGMPIRATTAAPIRNPLEPRAGHLDKWPPNDEPTGSAKKVR